MYMSTLPEHKWLLLCLLNNTTLNYVL